MLNLMYHFIMCVDFVDFIKKNMHLQSFYMDLRMQWKDITILSFYEIIGKQCRETQVKTA